MAPSMFVALSNSAPRKPSCMNTSTQANITPAMAARRRDFSAWSCRQARRSGRRKNPTMPGPRGG